MKTIKNNTQHVVVVSNKYFSCEVPINETITLSDSEIKDDCVFQFSYFSLKEGHIERAISIEKGIDRQLGLWYSSKSIIPVKTVFDVEHYNYIDLIEKNTGIYFVVLFFKSFCLKGITIKHHNNEKNHCFINKADKKRLFRNMCIELMVAIPILLLLLSMLPFLFIETWEMATAIIYLLSTFLFLCVCTRNIIHCCILHRWNVY